GRTKGGSVLPSPRSMGEPGGSCPRLLLPPGPAELGYLALSADPSRPSLHSPSRASKPRDPAILLLFGNFVARGSSLRTTEWFIIRCGLCMDKEQNVADTRSCGL
uniref:Uncharacterized protein n=1 Tax=Catharus ustulatus TaxID=91951 RepID=A0A8C3U854_CATUS